jgi:hypothetical protein
MKDALLFGEHVFILKARQTRALAASRPLGSGDFHEKAVKVKVWFTCDY